MESHTVARWLRVAAVWPALLLAAAGCATPSYEDVQPKKGAEVTLTNSSDKPALVQVYLGPDCTDRHPIRSPGDQKSQMGPNQSRAFTFAPGKPFSVELDYAVSRDGYFWNGREQKDYCRQIYTFTPEERSYAIIFSLGESACGAELFSAGHEGLIKLDTAEYLKPRTHRASLSSGGPWCEAP
jgi:hypothetical protein